MEIMNTSTSPRLTIGILTMNEERRIEACIRSALFADEIVVVDSGSKDRLLSKWRASPVTGSANASVLASNCSGLLKSAPSGVSVG